MEEWIVNKILQSKTYSKEKLRNKLISKKISADKINDFFNCFDQQEDQIEVYKFELKTDDKYKKILFLNLKIVNQNIDVILKCFAKLFASDLVFILFNYKDKFFWFSFNKKLITDQAAEKLFKNKDVFFVTKKIIHLKLKKLFLKWDVINRTSVLSIYDQIARLFYYVYYANQNEISKPFQQEFNWEYLFNLKEKFELIKKIKAYEKKKRAVYNHADELSISHEIKQIQIKLKEINKYLEETERMFSTK